MDLAGALLEVGTGRADASFALFAQTLDPQWIDAALQATGTASVRRRKLPAESVVWLVIGMGLLRDRSIEEVVRHLLTAARVRRGVTAADVSLRRPRRTFPAAVPPWHPRAHAHHDHPDVASRGQYSRPGARRAGLATTVGIHE